VRRPQSAIVAGAVSAAIAAAPSPAPAAVDAPSREHGATTAQIVAATHARARPGGGRRVWRVSTLTSWSEHAQTLLVLDSAVRDGREWLEVLLPIRPNGTTGWIPRDKALLRRTAYWIDLRLGTRTLTVYRDGRRVRRMKAVIGAPGTPTPRGLAAIYERNAQPDPRGFLGPWSLSLTALSRVLESFGGGPGRVAIHGREGASLRDPLGSARSHGCVRIDSKSVGWLAGRAQPGTPVRVR
jgi:lipoprotein-anchoring transpeptidase ErfK/SrfK